MKNFLIFATVTCLVAGDGHDHGHGHDHEHHSHDHGHHEHHETNAAPASSYAAPTYIPPANPAPTYNPPAPTYTAPAAPSASYGVPSTTYETPEQYNSVDEQSNGFDLNNIMTMFDVPLIIAILAAIVVAQLFAPLLGMLFGAKLDFTAGLLTPLTEAKVNLINAVLSPFNLVLGNVGTCTAATGRGWSSGFNLTPENVLDMILMANDLYNDAV